MKFLADENLPKQSIDLLQSQDFSVKAIIRIQPGMPDKQIIKYAKEEDRTILTHDSDYGELIFKHGLKPEAGVIYFRLDDFSPTDPARLLIDIMSQEITFSNRLTVITTHSIRQRRY